MTEKKLYDLKVDPEFRDLIPPLSEEELKLPEKSDLVLRLEPLLRTEARARQATSTGGANPQLTQNSAEAGAKGETRKGLRTDLVQNSDRGSDVGRTRDMLAGVSHDTILKVKKLNALALVYLYNQGGGRGTLDPRKLLGWK